MPCFRRHQQKAAIRSWNPVWLGFWTAMGAFTPPWTAKETGQEVTPHVHGGHPELRPKLLTLAGF